MDMNLEWIRDPKVYRINRLDAKASISYFKDEMELNNNNSQYVTSLNGYCANSGGADAEQRHFWNRCDGVHDGSKSAPISIPFFQLI